MTKREKVQEFILKYIKKITKGDDNVKLYEDLFKSMSNQEFDQFMQDLRDEKINLSIIIPPDESTKYSVKENIKIAKELGHDFFQRLVIKGQDGLPSYTTNQKALVYQLPVRRTVQTIDKKQSIAVDSNVRDMLTGQVATTSKTRRLSYPETQVLAGYGLDKALQELLQARGGDIGEGDAMDRMLAATGNCDLETLASFKTGVRSTKVLNQYLNGMHIRTTLK